MARLPNRLVNDIVLPISATSKQALKPKENRMVGRSTTLARASVAMVIAAVLLAGEAAGQSYNAPGLIGGSPAWNQSYQPPPTSPQFDSWTWSRGLDQTLQSRIHDPGFDRFSTGLADIVPTAATTNYIGAPVRFESWTWGYGADPTQPSANLFQELTTNSTGLTDMNLGREAARSVGTSIASAAISELAPACGAALSLLNAGLAFRSWFVGADVINGQRPPEDIMALGIPGLYAYCVANQIGGLREAPTSGTFRISNTWQTGSSLIDEYGTVSIQRNTNDQPYSETRTYDVTTVERTVRGSALPSTLEMTSPFPATSTPDGAGIFFEEDLGFGAGFEGFHDISHAAPFEYQPLIPPALLDRTLPQAIDWQTGFNVNDLIGPTIGPVDQFQILQPIKPIDFTPPPRIDLYKVINPIPMSPPVDFSPIGGRY